MKIYHLILLLLISYTLCSKEKMMSEFVKCANAQVGKEYTEEDNRGPNKFSNSGLVWYCRGVAGLSTSGTIYVSWKNVKKPKVGAYVYGITKYNGPSVSTESLGIIVSINPTIVVAGDKEKGVLRRQPLVFKKQYLDIEYHYVDF